MVAKVKKAKSKRVDSDAPGTVEARTVYTLTAFAKVIGKKRQTINDWVNAGLPVFKVGRATFIRGADFFKWLGEREKQKASVAETQSTP